MSDHGTTSSSHDEGPTTTGTPARIAGWVLIIISALILMLWWASGKEERKAEADAQKADNIRRAQELLDIERTIAAQNNRCKGAHRWIEHENIPDSGVAEYLCPGWKTFPLGGSDKEGGITITTPDRRTLRDAPGVKVDFGWQPEGDYIFRPDPIGSKRGVRIFTR